MRLRPIDFRRLREMISPMEVLRYYHWEGHWTPSAFYRGPCPIHLSTSRRSRSFSVGAEMAWCWKCHWRGDAVALWAGYRGLAVLPAAYDLCRLLGLSPPVLRERF